MLKKNGLAVYALIIIIFIIIFILLYSSSSFLEWAQNRWLDIVYALIMAVLIGALIEFIYRKTSPTEKLAEQTLTINHKEPLAKLVLPDKNQFVIMDSRRVFGREDFLGILVSDKLFFIGKKHFEITKTDNGFYIKDLDTKNGTKLNNEDIGGLGKKK